MGAELFHADGRTDMTQLVVAFRNFANALQNTQEIWTDSYVENYFFSERLRGVIGQVVPDVSKDHSAFIFSSWATLQHDLYENVRC